MIFVKGSLKGRSLGGPEFLGRISPRCGVYLEFHTDDVNLGIQLNKAAGRFRKRDMLHMGKMMQRRISGVVIL